MITISATFDKMLKQRIFMLFHGNRDVTHTYNLTISTDKSQYNYKESIFIEGVLLKDGSPSSDTIVHIFYDDTLVGTSTTTSGGVFTKSISNNVVGEHEIKVICGSTESNIVEIVTGKISTSLDIDVPLSLVYSDAFNITGTLLDIDNIALANKPVKLKVGSTIVDTQTTNSNGVVSFTQTPVTTGTHTFQLVYSGDENYDGIDSTSVTRSVNKETTVLAVTSPTNNSTIYVDEGINVIGTLVTDDYEYIGGGSVVVSENGNTLKTLTTENNGIFAGSLTGLSAGTHSLKFEFVSDTYYTGSSVTRSVIVNNHSYSLSANVDHSAILLNDSVTISGVLLKDGNGYANQTITIYDGATSKGTCTTNSNGAYSKTITGLAVGSHSLKAVNTNAESSTITVTVTEPTPVHDYSLSVASTKDILSYADSESATLTATLLDNNVAVAGETLSYVIKHGATTIDSGTGTTDSNGEISISYTGTGVGDVDVIVSYGSLLQETYDVIDYVSYDDATTDKTSKYIIANLNSHTFSTDHYVAERTLSASASATYYSLVHETYNLPTDFEASVDLLVTNKSTSDHQFGLCISPDYPETYSGTNQCFLYSNRNRFALGYRINGSLSNYGAYNSDFSTNTWYTFYIKVQGTTVTTTIKQGSNTIQSYTGTHSNIQSWKKLMLVIGGNSNNMYWKNLKVKAL